MSAARNRGVDEADADWLMFVDGDDWVSEDFCGIPYKAAIKVGADLVIFQCDEIKGGVVLKGKTKIFQTGIVNKYKAHEDGGIEIWNKIYRRRLFNDIRFPEGEYMRTI